MTDRVFTDEYLCFEIVALETAEREAAAKLEVASLRLTIARILQAGGQALHCSFVAGSEPRWKHESQRETLIELSDVLRAAYRQIGGSK